jgi:hypothetical protein
MCSTCRSLMEKQNADTVRAEGFGFTDCAGERRSHNVCEEHKDIATASLIEVWIDETERRTWFLFEASRHGDATRH